jgi:hypothetical protein
MIQLAKTHRWPLIFIGIGMIISTIAFLFLSEPNHAQDPQQLVLQKQYTQLQANSTSMQTQWLKTLNRLVSEVEGNIVWDTTTQQGVMMFINLPQSKAGEHYHLWIYDLKRHQQDPISGGIFNTTGKKHSEYWVAISPAKKVIQPFKFVILLETDKATVAEAEEAQVLLLAQP